MGDSVGCVVALGEGVIINLFWSEGRKCEGFSPERHDWLYLRFNLGLEETAPLFWVNIPRIQISAGGKTGFTTEVRQILRGIWRKLMRRESGILQRAQYNQRGKASSSHCVEGL